MTASATNVVLGIADFVQVYGSIAFEKRAAETVTLSDDSTASVRRIDSRRVNPHSRAISRTNRRPLMSS